jgi:tRNA(Ile)-lysidine synthase
VQIKLPDGEAVAVFVDATAKLTTGNKGKILLAVSGGPDSLAMLLLAKAGLSNTVAAATVDHRLRPEAAQEAGFVGQICADLGIPHTTLAADQPITGNIQSSARTLRYNLLAKHAKTLNCQWIATAHHADDQLETLLMRIIRGSGVDGLAAIRSKNGAVIRPCLGFSKMELVQICQNAGIEPVSDPSNDNRDFDRVRLRQWLDKPGMSFDAKRVGRAVSALSDASDALNWVVDGLVDERIKQDRDGYMLDPKALPKELQRRLVLRTLALLDPTLTPRGDAIDMVLTDLAGGKRVTMGNLLCSGGEIWNFRPAPPRLH